MGDFSMRGLSSAIRHIPPRHYPWYLLAIWVFFYLASLGLAPLFDYDETIYAQTAADMMHLGEWIVPTANGQQFFEKPPFTYYMMDLCFSLFGENAFAARLPSALFTLLTALLLFRFGRAIHSAQFGMAAALVYLSMFEVGLLGHAAILDGVLNFFIAASLLYYFRWLHSDQQRHALMAATMMGLAVSIKGPVGAVVPLLVIGVERMLAGEFVALLRRIPWGRALLLFLITATPWYVMIWLRNGSEFLYEFIMVHNIGRALHPMQGHGGAWHYYLVVFALSVLPWLAWMPALLRAWQRRADALLPQLIRLVLIWVALVIVLFSFAQTKLPHYISCIYPGVALGIAALWWMKPPVLLNSFTWLSRATVGLLLPVALLLLCLPLLYGSLKAWVHHPRAVAVLAQDVTPGWPIALAGALLLAALILLWRQHRQPRLHHFIALGLLLQSCLLVPVGIFAGQLAQGPQSRIAEVIRTLPPTLPIYSYSLNFPSISFRSGRAYRAINHTEAAQLLAHAARPYAVVLRSESRAQLPWLAARQPVVDQGGFLFYVVQP